jgi:hypothetical protein
MAWALVKLGYVDLASHTLTVHFSGVLLVLVRSRFRSNFSTSSRG